MEEYIAFDSHKHYTWVEREPLQGGKVRQERVEHAPGAIRRALEGCRPGTSVALEATANWYWIVEWVATVSTFLTVGSSMNKSPRSIMKQLTVATGYSQLPTTWPGSKRPFSQSHREFL